MTVAAALAAHAHLLPPRPSPSTSPRVALATIPEATHESAPVERDLRVSSPCMSIFPFSSHTSSFISSAIASTPSLSSSRNASFDSQSFPASPVSTCSPLAESVSSVLSSASSLRRNEHLAVLIPKDLWKVCILSHCAPDASVATLSHANVLLCTCLYTRFDGQRLMNLLFLLSSPTRSRAAVIPFFVAASSRFSNGNM